MEKSGFFNSVGGDRKYKAEDWANYFKRFVTNGIFPVPSTNLQVMANSDMTITVKAGAGWINGYIYENTSELILPVDAADGVLSRIDRVALKYDTVAREIKAIVKKGSFSSSPVAPALQRDSDAYELGIADISIAAGAASIEQVNITDIRLNTELCGIVNSLIQADTTTLLNQYESGMQAKMLEFQEDFEVWFATIQDILDEDTAGNLLNLINANSADITAHEEAADPHEQYALDTDLATLQGEVTSHKADIAKFIANYEYQPPTIVGTQIQVVNQSDSNIVKFRMDEDLSGGAITISLDAGATSAPLVDIDGVPVTELDKGFVEVVENSINFTYAPKGASLKEANEIILLAESIDYGGIIMSITADDNYIYVGGDTTKKVYKLSKLDLSKVAESIDYGGDIMSITADDNYIYAGGGPTNKVYKLNKSDLSKVAESSTYGGNISSITADDNYLYVGGYTTKKVYKLNKSDLSKVAESLTYGGNILSITADDNYIYVGGYTTKKVYKLNKSDLSKVAESLTYGGNIMSITADDNYIYVGGYTTKKVYKLNKSDLSKVAESLTYGGNILSITADDNYIYVGGDTTKKVYKLSKLDLSKVAESIDYGGNILSITADDNYIYAGGITTKKVYKLSKVAYLYKNLKLALIGSV